MENTKFFDIISDKVYNCLKGRNFTQNKVESSDDNELVSLYTDENNAYTIIYYKDKKQVLLKTCKAESSVPDNDWFTISKWIFDPETDDDKQANSIASDFCDSLSGSSKRITTSKKKKKNSDDGNADPLFFSKRMVNVFPEIKEEIVEEQSCYVPFRGATFAKKSIVPKVNGLLKYGDKQSVQKLAGILNTQYNNGDLDTRSIITIVVLNSIDSEKSEERLQEFLSEELMKCWKCAKKFKGKKVKPEKDKPRKKTMVERLSGSM